MSRLADKVAVVTGASKGIGRGVAMALAAAGARVAVNYSSDKEGAERVAQTITMVAASWHRQHDTDEVATQRNLTQRGRSWS